MAIQSNEFTNEEADGPPDFPDGLSTEGTVIGKKNKWQTKTLTSSQTSAGTMFTFNGLTEGKIYRIDISASIASNTIGKCQINLVDGSTIKGWERMSANTTTLGSGGHDLSYVFEKASGTSITIDAADVDANNHFFGAGSGTARTQATLIERNDLKPETTDFT